MRVRIGDVRLFFDVEGPKLVPEGPWMRERPTIVLLHPGPGFDHTLFKLQLGPSLARSGQVLYVDQRGGGRSDMGPSEDLCVERWAEDVRGLCDALRIERPVVVGLGVGSVVAIEYAARYPEHPAALVLAGPVARILPGRSIAVFERLGGEEAREVATRYYGAMDERAFVDFLRVCFPLLSGYELTSDVIARADWSPEVLIGWMRGEAKELDVRERLGLVRAPTLVLAGEDDAWAPLESAREVAELLPAETTRFHSYPGARHSVFRDAPQAYDDLHDFLVDFQAQREGA